MKSTNKKLLIIEDEKSLSRMLRDNLEVVHGIEVLQAYDGQEGLEKAKDFKPDLILLDIVMPIMNGIQFLRTLRNDTLLKDIKVIVLTNLSTDPELAKLKELKFTDCIVKSNWNIEDVISRVLIHMDLSPKFPEHS
jgi:CheY-like chemotaxis protein